MNNHTLQNTNGELIRRGNDRSRNRRTLKVPFIATCSHFTRKRKVSCSGFLPNTRPMQQPCSHYNAFCSVTWQTCMYLRTWQHKMTTIMQPFQFDLQAQIQETDGTTPTWTFTGCRTPRVNRFDNERIAAATAAHTRYPSSPPAATLREKHQASCSGFLPNRSPMQHSCGHYNAFFKITRRTRIYLRTWKHKMKTI